MFNKLDGINDLVYGNLDRDSHSYMDEDNVFTKLFSQYSQIPFPTPDETYTEVSNLEQLQIKYLKKENWSKYREFMEVCDMDITEVFRNFCGKLGIEYKEMYLTKIQEKLGGLVMQLKHHYNRPRPYQFAYYSGQTNFHNFNTISGNTPAYPSGHSCQSWFMCNIIAFHNPTYKEQLLKLGHRIAHTREVMGVHYASDTAFGRQIANSLMKQPEIQKTYFTKRKQQIIGKDN